MSKESSSKVSSSNSWVNVRPEADMFASRNSSSDGNGGAGRGNLSLADGLTGVMARVGWIFSGVASGES